MSLTNAHIVFVSPPFAGHLYPMIPFMFRAKECGANVSVYTGLQKCKVLERLGFTCFPVLRESPQALENIANPKLRVGSHPFKLYKQFNEALRVLPQIQEELVESWDASRPDLVVSDSVAVSAGVICERLRIPWITTIATPFAIENSQGTPAYFGGLGDSPHPLARLRNWAARKMIRTAKQTIFQLCKNQIASLGVSDLYRADGSETIYSPYRILGFGLKELEFERDWPTSFRMVGPSLYTPEANWTEIEFPDKPDLILVTLGTHLLWAKATIVERLLGMFNARPDLHFCISLGEASKLDWRPMKVGCNWSVYNYIPYETNIDKFKAVIHHGGAGITYSCLANGIPMIVCPQDYDQFDYAQRISQRGLGIRVKRISSRMLEEALSRLWTSDRHQKLETMKEYVLRYDPKLEFQKAAEEVLSSFHV